MVGPARDFESQEVHDRVITEIALSGVDLEKYHVGTNPGKHRHYPIRNRYIEHDGLLYPDLVIMNMSNGRVQCLYEVETEESVDDEHARLEWKPYSSLGWKLTLVVPKNRLNDALQLVDKHKVSVEHVGTYEVNPLGSIELDLPRFI